jgi:hypothetical protein
MKKYLFVAMWILSQSTSWAFSSVHANFSEFFVKHSNVRITKDLLLSTDILNIMGGVVLVTASKKLEVDILDKVTIFANSLVSIYGIVRAVIERIENKRYGEELKKEPSFKRPLVHYSIGYGIFDSLSFIVKAWTGLRLILCTEKIGHLDPLINPLIGGWHLLGALNYGLKGYIDWKETQQLKAVSSLNKKGKRIIKK